MSVEMTVAPKVHHWVGSSVQKLAEKKAAKMVVRMVDNLVLHLVEL